MITWTASNNNSFLNGRRQAKSILAAVRAGRRYVESELMGEGTVTIMRDGEPVRRDELSAWTKFKWARQTEF